MALRVSPGSVSEKAAAKSALEKARVRFLPTDLAKSLTVGAASWTSMMMFAGVAARKSPSEPLQLRESEPA